MASGRCPIKPINYVRPNASQARLRFRSGRGTIAHVGGAAYFFSNAQAAACTLTQIRGSSWDPSVPGPQRQLANRFCNVCKVGPEKFPRSQKKAGRRIWKPKFSPEFRRLCKIPVLCKTRFRESSQVTFRRPFKAKKFNFNKFLINFYKIFLKISPKIFFCVHLRPNHDGHQGKSHTHSQSVSHVQEKCGTERNDPN